MSYLHDTFKELKLKNENDRLRAALQMMVDHNFGPGASDMSLREIEVLARAALKPLT